MFLIDRLQNFVSGLGTSKDKRIASVYGFNPIDPAELNAMHRSDWMARKIVDIIPDDMTREWREWKADEATVEKIEEIERAPQINIQAKVNEAMQLARLRGGSAIVLGMRDNRPEDELILDRVKAGDLVYVHVLSRDEISFSDINRDVTSPYFGEPIAYQVQGPSGTMVGVHPSRVIRFVGAPIIDRQFRVADCWGDSVLQIVYDAVQNAASSQEHIASLIPEAKTDVMYIPNLSQHLQSEASTAKLTARFTYANTLKSMFNMILLEGNGGTGPDGKGEKWEQKTINFAQFPELMRLFLQVAAGAADIPLTRFLQDAPSGLGSNGEHSLKNYYDNISAKQRNWLSPALWRFDEVCIRSAMGKRDPAIYYEWAPLYTQSEKERAETFKIYADGARAIIGSSAGQEIVARDAISRGLVNRIVEDGILPGLAEAVDEFGEIGEQEPSEEEIAAAAALQANAQPVAKPGQPTKDAAPRTLYVSRKVINGDDIIAWAKGQGFTSTLPAEDLHVTITFSRTPVDWMQMGSTWEDEVKVPRGGARLIEVFGEGAVVLLFNSNMLQWRHQEMVDKGASWDHPDYQPHITIAYEGAPADISKIEPYQGEIILGPELFAEVNEDWKSSISEE
jgi:phage-related protein (TIGR01555 family)